MSEQLKDENADKQAKRQMEIDDNMQAWNYMIAKLKVAQADAAVDKQAITDIITSGMPLPGTPPQGQPGQPQGPQGPQPGIPQGPPTQPDPLQPPQ
jgi:hypothetical protein